MNYRFRKEGDLLVLQVAVRSASYEYGYRSEPKWRDATVEDIPVNDPFQRVEHVYVGSPPGPVLD